MHPHVNRIRPLEIPPSAGGDISFPHLPDRSRQSVGGKTPSQPSRRTHPQPRRTSATPSSLRPHLICICFVDCFLASSFVAISLEKAET